MGDEADWQIERDMIRAMNVESLFHQAGKKHSSLDFIWITKDGQKLRPENMETSHIENILKCKTLSCGELDRETRRIFLGELALRKETL